MRYKFTIDESTVPPTKPEVVFRAKSVERSYQFVIRVIILDPDNEPLKRGTLYREGAFGWEPMMKWNRKSGWSFMDGRNSNVVDNRIAPGC